MHGEGPPPLLSLRHIYGYSLPIFFFFSSPGRFFAIWVLKLFLIHCVLNYEVKTQERVPARFIWGQQVSHMDIKLKMRMRKGIGRK